MGEGKVGDARESAGGGEGSGEPREGDEPGGKLESEMDWCLQCWKGLIPIVTDNTDWVLGGDVGGQHIQMKE